MYQIRVHGRGGQGVVTAAELIAIAAFYDGKQSQAFPAFGVERTGAPIESYARIDSKFIKTREQIQDPDIVIVMDATLVGTVDVLKGAHPDTTVIINSSKSKSEFQLDIDPRNIYLVDATKIALDILGQNIVNTVILGAFAKDTKLISLDGIKKAIQQKFAAKHSTVVEKNIKAVTEAYNKAVINK